jgi:hypothetical protein
MKTPAADIADQKAFPSSVVEVATAVPAFIGYTEFARNRGRSLLNQPWRISPGWRPRPPRPPDHFRAGIGVEHLNFAAAHYPWLHTSVVPTKS